MCSRRFFWILLLVLTLFNVSGQNTHYDFGFVRNQAVSVIENGHSLSYAWAGGLNSVHFSEIDLDLDGVPDLLGFEKHGNRLLPFLRHGNGYEYAPQYSRCFPDLHDWVILYDYNGDGRQDIFTYGLASIRVFENVSEDTLAFQLVTDALQAYYYNGYTNIYASPDDYLVVDRAREARHGDIVIAEVNQEFTVKYLELVPAPRLVPANRNYRPILITPELECQIIGVVVTSLRKY